MTRRDRTIIQATAAVWVITLTTLTATIVWASGR